MTTTAAASPQPSPVRDLFVAWAGTLSALDEAGRQADALSSALSRLPEGVKVPQLNAEDLAGLAEDVTGARWSLDVLHGQLRMLAPLGVDWLAGDRFEDELEACWREASIVLVARQLEGLQLPKEAADALAAAGSGLTGEGE